MSQIVNLEAINRHNT